MDGASAVTGLIGLAALAGQSTVKLIKFYKDTRGLSSKLQHDLRWLTRLERLLLDFQQTYTRVQGLQLDVDFSRVEECLHECHIQAQDLVQTIETRLSSLHGPEVAKRRLKQIIAAPKSEEVEGKIQDLRQAVELLEVCNSNMGLYVSQTIMLFTPWLMMTRLVSLVS